MIKSKEDEYEYDEEYDEENDDEVVRGSALKLSNKKKSPLKQETKAIPPFKSMAKYKRPSTEDLVIQADEDKVSDFDSQVFNN